MFVLVPVIVQMTTMMQTVLFVARQVSLPKLVKHLMNVSVQNCVQMIITVQIVLSAMALTALITPSVKPRIRTRKIQLLVIVLQDVARQIQIVLYVKMISVSVLYPAMKQRNLTTICLRIIPTLLMAVCSISAKFLLRTRAISGSMASPIRL